jgi:hypothetical protein
VQTVGHSYKSAHRMSTSPHTTTRPPEILVASYPRSAHAPIARSLGAPPCHLSTMFSTPISLHSTLSLSAQTTCAMDVCSTKPWHSPQSLDRRKIDLVFGAYSAFVENLTPIVHDPRSFFRSLLPSLTADEVTFLAMQLAVGVSQWRVLNQLDQRTLSCDPTLQN